MQISVIICTHNPRKDYLRRTLDALQEQTLPREQWELLLIDNASNESLSSKWDLAWHAAGRHIRENEPGLTPARLRGIAEARGELLVFVDDDNVLSSGFLEESLLISRRFPQLGAWGGQIFPEFEDEPAPTLKEFLPSLALREVTAVRWSNYDPATVPYGAGLCVRKCIALRYAENVSRDATRRSLDRKGSSLLGGGDLDLAMTSYGLGLGTGIFPQLKLTHLIPRQRLDRDYLYRICVGGVYSYHLVNFLHLKTVPPRLGTARKILRLLRRLQGYESLYAKAVAAGTEQARIAILDLQSQIAHR